MQRVVLNEAIDVIGEYAFYNCSSLTNVSIPTSVTVIDKYAFYNCSGLKGIMNIPQGVSTIETRAFYGCSGLTGVNIPDTVTSITSYAFAGCENIVNVVVPDSVETIAESAFYGCNKIESITLPFVGASHEEPLVLGYIFGSTIANIPVTLKKVIVTSAIRLSDDTFADCAAIEEIVLPNTLTYIGQKAFYKCSRLTRIILGSGIETISFSAFDGCENISYVNYLGTGDTWCNINFYEGKSNPIYYAGSLYIQGEKLTSLVVSDTITDINKYAFYNCKSLKSVVIGANVDNIHTLAFSGCTNLDSVTFIDTDTWYYFASDIATSYDTFFSSSSLLNTSMAATYLTTSYTGNWRKV